MAKAGVPPKKKAVKAKLSDKEQSERFIETARELEADESGAQFERTVAAIIAPNRPKNTN